LKEQREKMTSISKRHHSKKTTSSSCSRRHKTSDRHNRQVSSGSSFSSSCFSSCHNKRSDCSTLSCLNENKGDCMLVRQFLDFNTTGAIYVNRIIPVPCCVEVDGLDGSENRLGLKFQEMKAPFFVEVARNRPHYKGSHHHNESQTSRSYTKSKKSARSTRKTCSRTTCSCVSCDCSDCDC